MSLYLVPSCLFILYAHQKGLLPAPLSWVTARICYSFLLPTSVMLWYVAEWRERGKAHLSIILPQIAAETSTSMPHELQRLSPFPPTLVERPVAISGLQTGQSIRQLNCLVAAGVARAAAAGTTSPPVGEGEPAALTPTLRLIAESLGSSQISIVVDAIDELNCRDGWWTSALSSFLLRKTIASLVRQAQRDGKSTPEVPPPRAAVDLVMEHLAQLQREHVGVSPRWIDAPVTDHVEPTMDQMTKCYSDIVQCVADDATTSEGTILFFCKGGHGRSAALALSFLLTHPAATTLSQSLSHLRLARPHVRPRLHKQLQLNTWARSIGKE